MYKNIVAVVAVLLAFMAEAALAEQEPLKIYDDWGGEFSLTDHNGFPFALSDFAGKVVLLNFGYTHCPDICPSTMFTMKRVINKLGEDADQVQVLFITLDPERDHPERLRAYVEFFNPGFLALTGSEEEIAAVAEKYGTKFEKENFDAEGNYSIAHNAVIYLIDQQGRIRVFFRITAPAETIVEAVNKLLPESQ